MWARHIVIFITCQWGEKYRSARKFISPWGNNHRALLPIALLFPMAFTSAEEGGAIYITPALCSAKSSTLSFVWIVIWHFRLTLICPVQSYSIFSKLVAAGWFLALLLRKQKYYRWHGLKPELLLLEAAQLRPQWLCRKSHSRWKPQ